VSLQTALKEIESHEFSARLGIANTMEMLLDVAQQERAVKELLLLLQNRDEANNLLSHVVSRLTEQEDIRYRNSRDIAIAVCIWSLNRTQPALAKLLAADVLSSPRLWWARRVALEYALGRLIQPDYTRSKDTLTLKKTDWGTTGTRAKEVLVVSEPRADLIGEKKILDPAAIESTGDAVTSNKEIPGEFTANSSETNSTEMVEQ
jgi:hypothetical protein